MTTEIALGRGAWRDRWKNRPQAQPADGLPPHYKPDTV